MKNLVALLAPCFMAVALLAACYHTDQPLQVVSNDLPEMERDARALELYLQDKVNHKEHCPDLEWEQPDLDVYKETLTSHLPEECMA